MLLCSNVVKFVRQKIGEIMSYLPDPKNKISAAYQTVATAWFALKIFEGQPQQRAHSAPDFIQIGSFSAEL